MEQKKCNITKTKDIILFILLFIWILIPIFKMIRATALFTTTNQYKFMEIVGIIGIYLFVIEIYKNIKVNKDKKILLKELLPIIILMAYLVWTLISCIFAQDKQKAFYGETNRKEGYITYLIYAGFFSCAFLIESNKLKKYLLNSFIIVTIFNILLMNITNNSVEMLQIFQYRDIQTGVFNNQNHYGYYLLIATMTATLFFILEKNKVLKVLYGLAYLILLYNLILNNTFGCYIAFTVTIIIFFVYCIYKKENRIVCIISIFIFILMSVLVEYNEKNIVANNIKNLAIDVSNIFEVIKSENINTIEEKEIDKENDLEKNEINKEDKDNNSEINNIKKQVENSGSGRGKLWKYGIKIFLQKPILGYGADNLSSEYKKYNIEQDRPHNLIINLLATSGIPGFILYISGIATILFRGFKRLKDNDVIYSIVLFVIIAYLVSSMFGNSMYYTSPYYFIYLGILGSISIRRKEQN